MQGLEKYLQDTSFIAYIIVFTSGIITSFTPCVLPLIPIIAGYIAGQKIKRKIDCFFLSIFYTIGMAITFSALGAFASLTGTMFGAIQTSATANIIVGNIILLMALWILDVIYIPIPSLNPKMKKYGIISSFILGLSTGFISVPCVTPVLGTLLTYVATKQNLLFGITLLFTYAFGIGFLLIIVGTFTGFITTLKKIEIYSEKIKKMFGYAMLILAEYFFIKAGRFW
jgi:thiol:disulfide interchange protein DsbD